MEELTRKTPYLWPISISGDAEKKERMRKEVSNLKALTEMHSGRVLREIEFPDGFFLEMSFDDREKLESWKEEAHIR